MIRLPWLQALGAPAFRAVVLGALVLGALVVGELLPGAPVLWFAPAFAQSPMTAAGVAREQSQALSDALSSGVGAPSKVDLLDQATLRLSGKLQYVPRDIAIRVLTAFRRTVPDGLIGMLRISDREQWLATIRFVGDGFVDPAGLKAWSDDDLLASLRDEIAATNPERERQGQTALEVTRWLIPPRYDAPLHVLEWAALTPPVTATRERDSDAEHNIAVFGRDGYLMIEIVAPATTLRDGGSDFRLIVDNLHFNEGKTFEDFQRGRDRMASNGLEGLLGVRTLRHMTLLEGQLDSDRVMILAVGGSLVLGAGMLGLALVIVNRRRLRR